jgi:hypothetical protein
MNEPTHILEYYDDDHLDRSRWGWRYRELFISDDPRCICMDEPKGQFFFRDDLRSMTSARIWTNEPSAIAPALGLAVNSSQIVFYYNPKELLERL